MVHALIRDLRSLLQQLPSSDEGCSIRRMGVGLADRVGGNPGVGEQIGQQGAVVADGGQTRHALVGLLAIRVQDTEQVADAKIPGGVQDAR